MSHIIWPGLVYRNNGFRYLGFIGRVRQRLGSISPGGNAKVASEESCSKPEKDRDGLEAEYG